MIQSDLPKWPDRDKVPPRDGFIRVQRLDGIWMEIPDTVHLPDGSVQRISPSTAKWSDESILQARIHDQDQTAATYRAKHAYINNQLARYSENIVIPSRAPWWRRIWRMLRG